MIKLIIGGIGSGKSLTAIKEIVSRKNKVYTNFKVKSKNAVRLKVEHIIMTETIKHDGKKQDTIKKSINWAFWNKIKHEGFDIILDEVHNILHSRRAMTKWNTLFSMWLSQIRKMLGGSEENHLYLISQRLGAIDISARELAQEIIYVMKKILNGVVYIIKYVFKGVYCREKFESFMQGDKCYDYRSYFIGNPYFKYYDNYEIIDFGESAYI